MAGALPVWQPLPHASSCGLFHSSCFLIWQERSLACTGGRWIRFQLHGGGMSAARRCLWCVMAAHCCDVLVGRLGSHLVCAIAGEASSHGERLVLMALSGCYGESLVLGGTLRVRHVLRHVLRRRLFRNARRHHQRNDPPPSSSSTHSGDPPPPHTVGRVHEHLRCCGGDRARVVS